MGVGKKPKERTKEKKAKRTSWERLARLSEIPEFDKVHQGGNAPTCRRKLGKVIQTRGMADYGNKNKGGH